MDIDAINRELVALGISGVDRYCAKLVSNQKDTDRLDDLLSEANAAMMFSSAGFSVEMSDRPDLWLTSHGQLVAAEVKHFRWKQQDTNDNVALHNHAGRLVEYGDAVPIEGVTAWDQIANVARRKAAQFRRQQPYLLVIQSSSTYCVDDIVVRTATNILNEESEARSAKETSPLCGIVFLSQETRAISGQNVYYFEMNSPRNPIPQPVVGTLNLLRHWRPVSS